MTGIFFEGIFNYMRFFMKKKLIILCMLAYALHAYSEIDDCFLAVGYGGVIELRNPLTGERGDRIEVASGHSVIIPNLDSNQPGVPVRIPSTHSPTILSYVNIGDSWNLFAGFNFHQWNIYPDDKAVYYSTVTHGRQSAYALVKEASSVHNNGYSDYKIICGSTGGAVGLFNVHNGIREKVITQPIFSPGSQGITCFGMYQENDNYFLACGSHCGGCVDIYDYHTGKLVNSLPGFDEYGFVSGVIVFKHNNEIRIVASTNTGFVTCWKKTDSWNQEWNKVIQHQGLQKNVPINGLVVYKDAQDAAVKFIPMTSDGVIRVGDACTGTELKTLSNEQFATSLLLDAKPWTLSLVDIKPYQVGDSVKLAVTYKKNQREGFLAVWDVTIGSLEYCKKIPPAALTLFEDDEKIYCVTCGVDGIVRTWDLTLKQLVILFSVAKKNDRIKADTACLATRQGSIVDSKAIAISHSYVGTCGSDMPFFDLNDIRVVTL